MSEVSRDRLASINKILVPYGGRHGYESSRFTEFQRQAQVDRPADGYLGHMNMVLYAKE